MTTERHILIGVPIEIAVLTLILTLTCGWLTAVVVGSFLLVCAAGVGLMLLLFGRPRLTAEGASFRITVTNDGRLLVEEPGPRRSLVSSTNLAAVRHITWYVSHFSREGTIRIALWDRPSTFTLLGIDSSPDDPHARKLGEFRVPDLRLQSAAHRALLDYFQPRLADGLVTTTIDLETLEPTFPSHTAVAPGWIRFHDRLVYSPHLAQTERGMRAE